MSELFIQQKKETIATVLRTGAEYYMMLIRNALDHAENMDLSSKIKEQLYQDALLHLKAVDTAIEYIRLLSPSHDVHFCFDSCKQTLQRRLGYKPRSHLRSVK